MADELADDHAVVAELFGAVASPARVAILEAVHAERPMPEVADEIGLTRSGVQSHLDTLFDRNLVYRPGTDEYPYALTPFGQFFAVFLEQHKQALVDAVADLETAEEQARDELEEVPLSEEELERAVARRKWEIVGETLRDELAQLDE